MAFVDNPVTFFKDLWGHVLSFFVNIVRSVVRKLAT
jgi:hypothetical protein